jgi:hypothetical protein
VPAASRHIETIVVPGRRLGRRPHDPDRPTLRLASLLTGVVPDHPATVDHFSQVPPGTWGDLGNRQYGDCGPAMTVHDRMLITRYLSNIPYQGTTGDALDLYKRAGNPGFPRQDNGVVLADMLSEVHTNGVCAAKTKCVAYAQVNVADLDEVRAAIAIFGAVSTGADLDTAQQGQTDTGGPWDYVANSSEWGGHAFLTGFYSGNTTAGKPDFGGLTWGFPVGITDRFWTKQVEEAWVVIWPEHLTNRSFLVGVDQDKLAQNYKILTGRDLPTDPTPAPVPTAITADQSTANQQLLVEARAWLRYQHSGMNGDMARVLQQWVNVWGA